MSKANPLAGLIGNYEDSDEEEDSTPSQVVQDSTDVAAQPLVPGGIPDGILPPPIPHCAWSACYDETSGFTYYWNQNTNEVTWEAPPEYLLALKLAKKSISASGTVSAAEWQLYQQALAEKQVQQKASPPTKPVKKIEKKPPAKDKNGKPVKRSTRSFSDDEDIKIELITSYHNSDSESNDEAESPSKAKAPTVLPAPVALPVKPKISQKKQKVKQTVEFGPSLPPNHNNYSVPIGPELPPGIAVEEKPVVVKSQEIKNEEKKSSKSNSDNEDSQDENILLKKLKDKAKLLEKLGGEIPTELQKFIEDETTSKTSSPKICDETSRDSKTVDMNIDDLLEEIEKKELPKIKTRKTEFSDENSNNSLSNTDTAPNSPKIKSLFPSSKTIIEESETPTQNGSIEPNPDAPVVPEKKDVNLYISDTNDVVPKKKLRISNSVLPERKKAETPAYTTKYSQHIEGFSTERTGLGFSNSEEDLTPKNAISYGNGLLFTKGETLNEEKRDEDLDDMSDLVEAKLKYLCGVQPCDITPVNEMLIQMQTLVSAFRAGGVSRGYWRRWLAAAARSLRQHEAGAAPRGWSAAFQRSEGRYQYIRESDGFTQYEYPATDACDMEICTTPPPLPPPEEEKMEPPPPPPRASPPPPPPPAWDPPPPGCDVTPVIQPKQDDELLSFYNDIAEIEKTTIKAPSLSPEPPAPPEITERDREREREREDRRDKVKKKSKVKISSSIGLKHKTVSTMVAKWQKVSEEINSD